MATGAEEIAGNARQEEFAAEFAAQALLGGLFLFSYYYRPHTYVLRSFAILKVECQK
jgi:hypothetical protein